MCCYNEKCHEIKTIFRFFSFSQVTIESRVLRKPAFCIRENKGADQLWHSNRTADQRLCFRYIDNTIPLLPKSLKTGYLLMRLVHTMLQFQTTQNYCNLCKKHKSLVMRKLAFCICENKDADQLRGNREADQRLMRKQRCRSASR